MKEGSQSSGFSLLELMVVLAIVSISVGVAMVSLAPAYRKQQVKLATEELRQHVQVLRMKSILAKKTSQAKISNGQLFYRFKTDEEWSEWEKAELADSVDYSMSGSCYFYSKGYASPKTIVLTSRDYQQKLIININGRTRISQIF